MPIISIAIQKGGSGKTTTTLNLAAALQRQGKNVLLFDADPQASLSEALGVRDEPENNLFTELTREIKGQGGDLQRVIIPTKSGLPLIPSSIELAGAELELVSVYGREQVFTWMLDKLAGKYDFILIDCPPAIGMLTVNALVASDFILMPLQAEFLPLKGLRSFMHHFNAVHKLNRKLEILGFVLTRYDQRKIMNREMFQTRIRSSIQLGKAQQEGTDIFHYEPHSHGADDYAALAAELLTRLEAVTAAQAAV